MNWKTFAHGEQGVVTLTIRRQDRVIAQYFDSRLEPCKQEIHKKSQRVSFPWYSGMLVAILSSKSHLYTVEDDRLVKLR